MAIAFDVTRSDKDNPPRRRIDLYAGDLNPDGPQSLDGRGQIALSKHRVAQELQTPLGWPFKPSPVVAVVPADNMAEAKRMRKSNDLSAPTARSRG
jgi:hypothetical protein